MRVVLDTNTVVSGLLWGGNSRRIIDLARLGEITLCTSRSLLDELLDVLIRPKLAAKVTTVINATPQQVVDDYAALAEVVEVQNIEPIVARDPDDDEVIACAVAAEASYIVSGDRDLLNLSYRSDISILNAAQFMALFASEGS